MNINDFRNVFRNTGVGVQEFVAEIAALVPGMRLDDFKVQEYRSKVIDQICAVYHINEHMAKLTYDAIAKNYIETQVGNSIFQENIDIKVLWEIVFENNLEFVHCFCVELKHMKNNFKSHTCINLKLNDYGEIMCTQFDIVSNSLGAKQSILALKTMAVENGNVIFMRHWV